MSKLSALLRGSYHPAWRWVAAGLVLVGLVAATWAFRQTAKSSAVSDPAAIVYSDAPQTASQTDSLIASLQKRLTQYPDDYPSYTLLGAAYLQKVRETADPAYYTRADAVLHEAASRLPADPDTLTTLGALALERHQFQDGLTYGQAAHAANIYNTRALGVIYDGQTELGQYAAAAQTVQQMVNMRPDMSSYARVSYARELHGDVAGALQAMRLAAQAGGGVPENRAWTLVQVGNLYWLQGNLDDAVTEYNAALQAMPTNVPAQAGLAHVLASRGDLKDAIAAYEEVVSLMPMSEYVIALGDCYMADGQTAASDRQYALVHVLSQLQQANGVDVDLEITLFGADHPGRLEPMPATLTRARQLFTRRPTIYAADALAWTLYQTGSYSEARSYSDQALRLNTQDPLLWFHAGMIAVRLGDTVTARQDLQHALDINPHFSLLWSPVARQTLDGLPVE